MVQKKCTLIYITNFLCIFGICWNVRSTNAFAVAPGPLTVVSTPRYISNGVYSNNIIEMRLHPSSFPELKTSSSSALTTLKELSYLLVADGTDAGEVSAFTDQINYLDGPIVTMFGVCGLLVVALFGFKLLTDQMDSAIEKVLVDFEATMKKSYPQRWQGDIRPQLEGLEGESRQQKLVQIMEDIQNTDPEFMSRLQKKMKNFTLLE